MDTYTKIETGPIVDFIGQIGIPVSYQTLEASTFLPGIHIEKGGLLVDREKLLYPGDLLHEAGHLALMLPEERAQASGNLEPGDNKQDSLEIGAICWSWAALVHLKLDPKIVFHEAGYRGTSEWHIETFSSGTYIGLPLLQWMGLCKHQDDTSDLPPFPHMVKWLRD